MPFPSAAEAEIAFGSLSVDKEPKRGGVVRTMSVKDHILLMYVNLLFVILKKNFELVVCIWPNPEGKGKKLFLFVNVSLS